MGVTMNDESERDDDDLLVRLEGGGYERRKGHLTALSTPLSVRRAMCDSSGNYAT
jgi:hypothetical protein